MAPKLDPFYVVRQEIQEQVSGLHQKMSRFHGLTATNPERKSLARQIADGCEQVVEQVLELEGVVNKAEDEPQRFNLSAEEISSRKRWIDNTKRQVSNMRDGLANAAASTPLSHESSLPPSRFVANNDQFLAGQQEKQELLLRQQDQDLDELEAGVLRVGAMAHTIGQVLDEQTDMLQRLDEDVDSVQSRLRGTHKKIAEVIRKSSSNKQLMLIIVLVIVLVVLFVLAFY